MLKEEQVILNGLVTQKDPKQALVIAVTTRSIFDLEEEHQIFLTKGKEEYLRHQKANENLPLQPGTAFAFVKAVQTVNEKLLEKNPKEETLFDVIILSNHTPESGVRIVNSVKHYGLEISRFCFVGEEDSTLYLKSQNVKLFLSLDRLDVCNALKRGVSAAMLFRQEIQPPSTQLRVAFDGDSVLFSDETDRVFREKGLDEAVKYEKSMEEVPMGQALFREASSAETLAWHLLHIWTLLNNMNTAYAKAFLGQH
ncbi:cytosolic 5'-nucleotidase 1A-like isoform X2 [Ambystoma mexicanum]|uniref:cytosolic 5'-nucleotidase 1A-like isoform X2 n=1 Tax=Ambystoma mexicanum TaxID=8296 RepID=UPI0037E8BF7C